MSGSAVEESRNEQDGSEHSSRMGDEQRFRMLVESVRDYAIFMLDVNGNIVTWNEGAERFKGYKAGEIIGRHMSSFYTPEDLAAGRPQRLLGIAISEGHVEDEGWRVRKDGTRFWADVVITAVRDPSGELLGFSKVTRDLTDRKKLLDALRASEERSRLLIDSVKDYAILMLDPEGHVQSWNTGAERLKGYSAEEIVGKHMSVFYAEEDVLNGKPFRLLAAAREHGRIESEGWRIRKDGKRFWADVVLSAIRNASGTLIGFSKVTRDLTERHEAEAERLRLAQAQEGIRLRDEFLSIASHELKTPLTAMQLHLQSLREKLLSKEPALVSKVERAERSSERLSVLIESLLDVARISTGRLALRPQQADLSSFVGEVIDRWRESANKAGCTLMERITPGIRGNFDPLRIEQVLTNLLTNAFKYAAGKPVEVSLELAPGGEAARLEVRDHGNGISEESKGRIFGRFERAASMQHYGGLGLGLYISQEIIDGHGGSIETRNAEDGGAIFTVNLPLAPSTSKLSARSGEDT